MHRDQNQNYQRVPFTQNLYGAPPGPFDRGGFAQHYQNPATYHNPGPAHIQGRPSASAPTFQNFSTDPVYQAAPPNQFQQGWTLHQNDLQSLEVKKKSEEFLRYLEAKDRLELSGDTVEKGARKQSVDDADKHGRRTRSRSRNRSRGRSRGKSRARSRSRGRSRGRSRARSRSRSRSRGKSRTRAKSRARSRSRAKSQPRPDKRSHRSSTTGEGPTTPGGGVPDLIENLKQVLQSKDLEKHLVMVRSSFISKQTPDQVRSPDLQPAHLQNLPNLQTRLTDPEVRADLNRTPVLPHELAGGTDAPLPQIFPWDEPSQKLDPLLMRREFSSVEDEEEFLYGDEEGKKKPQAVTVPLAQTRPALQEPRAQAVPLKRAPTPEVPVVTVQECEKVRTMLRTIGLALSEADISRMAALMKKKQEEQRGSSPNLSVRNTAQILLNTNTVHTSEDGRGTRSGSSQSHRDPEPREKTDEREKERRERHIQQKRKEYLVKELQGLLKNEGSGDLIPVIGFFCQKCEEFFGDLSSAEGHKHPDPKQVLTAPPVQHKDPRRPVDPEDRDERRTERKRSRGPEEKSGETGGGKKDEPDTPKSEKKKKKKKEKKLKKKKEKKNKKEKQGKN
ncbi:zinc finger protein 318 [Trichomycterus rosablanca]|uniref:zinc finger protein 318 n=1 Tax=Trichomycterus rosablanca TaxID=2290929 RepID=UPI002F35240F